MLFVRRGVKRQLSRLRSLGTSPSSQFGRGLANTTTPLLPELTKDRYPHIKRGDFSQLGDNHLNFFKGLLGETRVLNDPSDCAIYNVDWIKSVRGYSKCVLKPKTTQEVSQILTYCNEHRLAVTPQGGNTGLVAGSVPVFDEIVLSLSLMNNILSIDPVSGVIQCEAGCILEQLDEQLANHNLMMPLDLGAKGSCQIGGNVSTNAGGLRLLRYGNLQGNVLGIEAVKASGQIVDCMSTLKKDNTGFHLKHLFIGSEGTLGIVTKVAIQCPPKPNAINLAFLGMESFDNILKAFQLAKDGLGEILSSFEMIDAASMAAGIENLRLQLPINPYPFYVLIETHGSHVEHDQDKVGVFLERLINEKIAADGTMTNEPGKMGNIWQLRERLAEAHALDGYVYKYDLSLPLDQFYSIVTTMRQQLSQRPDVLRCCGYGHIGDGNIHFTVTAKEFNADTLKKIEPFVYEHTAKLKGSISAEHGMGLRKPKYMHYSKSESAIQMMKDIKLMMDPKGILNPYKVLQ